MRSRDFPAYFPDGTRFYDCGEVVYLHWPGSGWYRVEASGLAPAADAPDAPPPLEVIENGREISEIDFPGIPVLRELHRAAGFDRDRNDRNADEWRMRAVVAEQERDAATYEPSGWERQYQAALSDCRALERQLGEMKGALQMLSGVLLFVGVIALGAGRSGLVGAGVCACLGAFGFWIAHIHGKPLKD